MQLIEFSGAVRHIYIYIIRQLKVKKWRGERNVANVAKKSNDCGQSGLRKEGGGQTLHRVSHISSNLNQIYSPWRQKKHDPAKFLNKRITLHWVFNFQLRCGLTL